MSAEGDILWGHFPTAEHVPGMHPGIVVGRFGAATVVLVGTSRGTWNVAGNQLVMTPADVGERAWRASGLSKPTRFDFDGGRIVLLGTRSFHAELIGTARGDDAWMQALAKGQAIVAGRLVELARATRR
ncbi:MAG TPA: hypothetical protein VFQ88_14140 [Nevskiaceae bacterium]|nr:hypothetical protein [Nevskiaceae bacterium]